MVSRSETDREATDALAKINGISGTGIEVVRGRTGVGRVRTGRRRVCGTRYNERARHVCSSAVVACGSAGVDDGKSGSGVRVGIATDGEVLIASRRFEQDFLVFRAAEITPCRAYCSHR